MFVYVVLVVHTLRGHIIEAKGIFENKLSPHFSLRIVCKNGERIFEEVQYIYQKPSPF